jgi:WD40 repeat protein/predicted Ser/Thr protein kinase
MLDDTNPSSASEGRFEEVLARILQEEEAGQPLDLSGVVRTYPDLETPLRDYFRHRDGFDRLAPCLAPTASSPAGPGPAPDPAPGSQFAGYQILRELGRGGMGVVYLARQPGANRLVALKLIRTDRLEHLSPGQRQQWLSRFRMEGQAAARVADERVVTVFEVGEADGRSFYSMRYVEGQSLAAHLTAGPVPNRRAAFLMEQVARAVQAVHDQGVLHRDLKPHNVLVDARGRPYVTDFGLAKWVDATDSPTQTGEMLGSAHYISPEQAENAANVSAATDVYGLGATLYALLTGRPPFQGTTLPEILHRVKSHEPVPPRRWNAGVDRDLDTITLACLEKETGRRYRSAAEVADELQRYLQGVPIRRRRPGPVGHLWRWCRRKPALAVLCGAVAALLVTVGITAVLYYLQVQSGEILAAAVTDEAKKRRGEEEAARKAVEGRKKAEGERDMAEGERDTAKEERKKKAYVTQMRAVQREYDANRLARVRELLEAEVPTEPGATDYRGFEWYYWHRLSHRELLTLKVSKSGVRSVAFSADGNKLFSAGYDQIQVWNSANGQALSTHKSSAISPDGRWLATTGDPGDNVRLTDAATGKVRHFFPGEHPNQVGLISAQVGFSPNGKRVAYWGFFVADAALRVWDVDTGQRLLNLSWRMKPGLAAEIAGRLAFSPDSQWIAWADWDTTVRVREVSTGKELATLEGHENVAKAGFLPPAVWGLAFSPDRKLLASAGADATVRVWDIGTRKALLTLQGNSGAVQDVAFSPDGKRLASAGRDSTVRVWDVATGKPLDTLYGHTGPVWSVAFSPDGKRLASGGEDETVRVWDAVAGPIPLALKGHTGWVRSVTFSPDGKRLASAGKDQTVRVWDVAGGQEPRTLSGPSGPVLAVAFSPDGRQLFSAGETQAAVRVWEVGSGKALRKLPGPRGAWALDVAFSSDGRRLAWADTVSLLVCESSNDQPLFSLPGGHGGPSSVGCVAFSPDDSRLASAETEVATVWVWDASSGERLRGLQGHKGAVGAAAAPIDPFPGVPDFYQRPRLVWGVAFSPDGKRLASAGSDATVRVWEVDTGKELHTLKGHAGAVLGVAFSRDGKRLASAGADATVRVWDATTGDELLTLKGHVGPVRGVTFSPDGKRLASAGDDATVRVW